MSTEVHIDHVPPNTADARWTRTALEQAQLIASYLERTNPPSAEFVASHALAILQASSQGGVSLLKVCGICQADRNEDLIRLSALAQLI